MKTRNFYVEGEVEGRTTPLTGGPAGSMGGMNFALYQRQDRQRVKIIEVICNMNDEGKLVTKVIQASTGELIYSCATDR